MNNAVTHRIADSYTVGQGNLAHKTYRSPYFDVLLEKRVSFTKSLSQTEVPKTSWTQNPQEEPTPRSLITNSVALPGPKKN